ncbi:MAG: Verru_Chthon cassette protein A [Verrucomicrobiota bacterium]
MKSLKPKNPRRGVAILTVLAVVVLSTGIVISLLNMSRTNLINARGGVEIDGSRRYADMAVQMVLAQLRTATTKDLSPGVPAPWSSQPGGVTVHREDGSVGEIYKLYSAEKAVAAERRELAGDLPVRWDTQPGQYVDLNAPLTNEEGGVFFPIADPRLAGPEGAEGFDVTTLNAPHGTTQPGENKRTGGSRLPMPVRWIYVLRDGTLGVLEDGNRFAPINGKALPAEANPIVARIAWWADDETNKINVNTASEAAPWDTPRLTTKQDEALARFQPTHGEYQRYPGHPAGVSLSSVLFPRQRWTQPGDQRLMNHWEPLTPQMAEGLWEMGVGTITGEERTSMGGTRTPPGLDAPPVYGIDGNWHRYAAPSELIYGADRQMRKIFREHPEAVTRLQRADFLMTTESRAPETTLFGTPRMSLWPIHQSVVPGEQLPTMVERASAQDSLLALCTTAAGRRYYFQRAKADDGWWDFNNTGLGANIRLFNWMAGLMDRPVPGFVKADLPKSFAEKYGSGPAGDAQNLMALMFDYIRTTNLADGSIPEDNQFSVICPGNETMGFGQISPLTTTQGSDPKGRWKESQLQRPRGMGRLQTINGAVLLLTCRTLHTREGKMIGDVHARDAGLLRPGDRLMEAAILFEGFVPGQGWAESRPYCSLVPAGINPSDLLDFEKPVSGLIVNEARLMPIKLGSLKALGDAVELRKGVPAGWTAAGGESGALAENTLVFAPFIVRDTVETDDFLKFDGSAGNGQATGFKVGIFDAPKIPWDKAKDSLNDLVQIIEMRFPLIPRRSLKLPEPPRDGRAFSLDERLRDAFSDAHTPLISAQDVAQAIVSTNGDSRLIAGQRVVGPEYFVAHPDYGNLPLAHRLRNEPVSSPPDTAPTGFFRDLRQNPDTVPDFTIRPWDEGKVAIAGKYARQYDLKPMREVFAAGRLDGGKRGLATPAETGDFDTGSGLAADGAYVNRADDGEVAAFAMGKVPYFDAPAADPRNLPMVSAAAASPNRLVPGAGMFGSLPTGVKARVPWQTLLFHPWGHEEPGETHWNKKVDHYGWSWPRDHLILDLFWMPVIEPYGISTPMETAGKINLNHELLPFRHIQRTTALHALLKSERIIAVPDADSLAVKNPAGFANSVCRYPIDATGTLKMWDTTRELNERPYLSASEVCTLPLVPEMEPVMPPDRKDVEDWWKKHRLTGDNLKERPYTNLHARLTTRSNTYRVHIYAQTLQKARSTEPAKWDEDKDLVMATWRGSSLVSRQIRAEDIPDYAAVGAITTTPVDHFYSWRVSGQRPFVGH